MRKEFQMMQVAQAKAQWQGEASLSGTERGSTAGEERTGEME